MSAVVDILSTAADRPPALDDRALFGHPRGLGLLFITEMWERFSYYGMRALLILYLTQALHWNTARAANLYGTYTMLVFLTPLIGGYLADRFIGTRRSLVIGGLIIAAGHFCLAVPSMTMFYTGLVLIIIGTGFFKPNVSTMVGQIYADGDSRRDAGFTIFYIGINTGAFLGGLVCGYLGDQTRFGDRGWHWGFGAAGVGMLLGLIVYLAFRDKYLPGIGVKATKAIPALGAPIVAGDSKVLLHGVIGAAAGIAVSVLLGGFDWLGAFVAATIGAALSVTILGSHGEERKRVIAIFIVAFFVVVFWACYEQAGSSMNLFAANNTQLQLGSFHIPAAWSQNVNPAVIVLFAPGVRVDLGEARQDRSRAIDRAQDGDRARAARLRIRLHGDRRPARGQRRTREPALAGGRVHVPHVGRALSVAGGTLVRDEGRAGALRVAAHGRVVPRQRRGEQDRGHDRRADAHSGRGARGTARRIHWDAAARRRDEPRLLHDLPHRRALGECADDLLRPAAQATHCIDERVSRARITAS